MKVVPNSTWWGPFILHICAESGAKSKTLSAAPSWPAACRTRSGLGLLFLGRSRSLLLLLVRECVRGVAGLHQYFRHCFIRHQALKPLSPKLSNPQALKPLSPKPLSPQAINPLSPQALNPSNHTALKQKGQHLSRTETLKPLKPSSP